MIGDVGVTIGSAVTTAEIVSYLPLTYFLYFSFLLFFNFLYQPIFIFRSICPIFAAISGIVRYFERYETKVFQYRLTGQYNVKFTPLPIVTTCLTNPVGQPSSQALGQLDVLFSLNPSICTFKKNPLCQEFPLLEPTRQ